MLSSWVLLVLGDVGSGCLCRVVWCRVGCEVGRAVVLGDDGVLSGVECSVGNGNSVLYCRLCLFDCVGTQLFVLPIGVLVVGRTLRVSSGLVSAIWSVGSACLVTVLANLGPPFCWRSAGL